jgi:hypothetical protein
MSEKTSMNIFRGLLIGLLGLATAGMGFAIATFFSRAVGVGLIWIGILTAAGGFVVHGLIFIERISKKRNR